MFHSGVATNILGSSSRQLYLWTSLAYLLLTLSALFIFPAEKLANSVKRVNLLLWVDIAALFILIHASTGIESGLGYLLIINMAMVTIFAPGRAALAYAAAIAIAVIAETIFISRGMSDFGKLVFASGILGILLFATTIALNYLTNRLRIASSESEEQSRLLRNFQEIAQNIVTRMQTGVIVVDNNLRIDLVNTSAKQMLNIEHDKQLSGTYLADLRELSPILKDWEDIIDQKKSRVIKLRPGLDIRVNVAHLETEGIPKNIFYLDDYSTIKQQAQQLKLASLGRLAGSIAHEIRNPLGAMSHAAQLLAESDELQDTDKRMTEIILNNSDRVNNIVENTLAMSRRKEPHPQQILITPWIEEFISDFRNSFQEELLEGQHEENQKITVIFSQGDIRVKFDPTHLRQILTNLIDNGLRYSELATGEASVEIRVGIHKLSDKAFIEIIDTGEGVDNHRLNEIYEPFYTTDDKGSGLGLYISKELVEINHASLHYQRTADQKSCFRIDFPHHQRMQPI